MSPALRVVSPVAMPVLQLTHTRLHYVEEGSGTPLLLVHGSLCDYRYWKRQLAPLATKYRVIALSLRHYWPQRWNGEGDDFGITVHAADLNEFIQRLQAGPVHLCGHSRGGLVALHAALQAPSMIRSLLLAEPGGRIQESPGEADSRPESPLRAAMPAITAALREGEVDTALERFLAVVDGPRGWARAPEPFKQMARDNAATLFGQSREYYPATPAAALAGLSSPVLLIGGERSPAGFGRQLDVLQRYLPHAERVTVPRASHPVNVENATVFNRLVLDFLDKFDSAA